MAEQKRGSLKPVTYIWININYLQENLKVSLSNSTTEFLDITSANKILFGKLMMSALYQTNTMSCIFTILVQ